MKANEAKAKLLAMEGKKTLDLALKNIEHSISAGKDNMTFQECKSDAVAEYVAKELSKMGYTVSGSEYYRIYISWR